MKNLALSRALLGALAARGVREVVSCAGARNAPLVSVLSVAEGVITHSFFEERSAAFFALGRIALTGRPVVVTTTSGTAVAECLPAVIEAEFQQLPLVILSADRPRRYRGTGAPQTITQPGLFSAYVEASLDLEGECPAGPLDAWSGTRPLHVNVCFDEPLLDEALESWSWPGGEPSARPARSSRPVRFEARSPLVVAGPMTEAEAELALPTLVKWQRPVIAEAPSQLRGRPELRDLEVTGGDPGVIDHDGIVRVGGVPTLRLWRDLEKLRRPVIHFSRAPWPGLPGEGVVHPLEDMVHLSPPSTAPSLGPDRARAIRLDRLLARFPKSEPAWCRRVSEWVPAGSHVFLGNSLPIREWDLAATRAKTFTHFANRGANGIDGLVSTFAGIASPARSNWALLGDLTTLYDLVGAWAFRVRPIRDVNLVVINNGGGRIFERLFRNPLFENRHDLEFGSWAKQWGFAYRRLDRIVDLAPGEGPRVIEIVPDENETADFWREWETK